MPSTEVIAVVPAAGVGSRMQADRPKQYLKIGNHTILEHTLTRLINHPAIDRVVVAISAKDPYFAELDIARAPWLTVVDGGKERADSVFNALQVLNENSWALVHDAARPCVLKHDIDRLIEVCQRPELAGGILATPVRDTMKRGTTLAQKVTTISHTESRDNLWHALTPQLFRCGQLRLALEQCLANQVVVTDEASAMEHCGHKVALVEGSGSNIKVTRPDDLALAQYYLQQELLSS